MIWHDLFVDRWVDARELKQAALAAFGVPVHHIEVTEAVPRGEAAHHERHLLLRRMRQSRDFPLQMTWMSMRSSLWTSGPTEARIPPSIALRLPRAHPDHRMTAVRRTSIVACSTTIGVRG